MRIYFALGSNIGDKKANIYAALDLMNKAFETNHIALSELIQTKSWGFEAEDFINCAVVYDISNSSQSNEHHSCEAEAIDILRKCKMIENQLGRKEKIEFDNQGKRIYHSRIIDIDILFYGTEKICLPELTIPHPRIQERDFVLIPLRQIADEDIKSGFPHLFERNI